jgi:VWFA-related protein
MDPFPNPTTGLPPVIIGGPQVTRTTRTPGIGGPGTEQEDYFRGREYLNKLAEYSGGRLFDGMQDLSYAFAEVAKELANQYSIGYYSNDKKHDGKFRKIEIKLNKPGFSVRTRKGYFAKKDQK